MKPSHCLRWYRTQKFLLNTNKFSSLACCKHIFLLPNKNGKFDSYNEKININEIQKHHSRSIRYIRRNPIDIIYHDKKKHIDDYIVDSKAQTAAPLITDDYETDFSSQMQDSIITQPQKKFSNKSQDNDQFSGKSKGKKNIDKSNQKSPNIKKSQSKNKNNHRESQEDCSDSESDAEDEHKVFKGLNILQYDKSQGKIRGYMMQGKSAHFREKENFFCVEGWRLLAEALNAGLRPMAIYFSRSRVFYNLIPMVAKSKEELTAFLNLFPLYKTSYSTFKMWSSLTTPPGIMAVFRITQAIHFAKESKTKNSLPLTVILDQIRDPNNLGSIIRTLVAAGVSQIILTKGCCNLWDIKVIRGSCGAHFHMHCNVNVPWSIMETYMPSSPSVYLANACHKKKDDDWEEERSSKELSEIRTPTKVLERIRENSLAESKNQSFYTMEDGQKILVNESYENEDHLSNFSTIDFPQQEYDEINYFDQQVNTDQSPVLIIGGETGLSNCARKFALEMGGVEVSIPMSNNIESLNSSAAISILVFEAKRQHKKIFKEAEMES